MTLNKNWLVVLTVLVVVSVASAVVLNRHYNLWTGTNVFAGTTTFSGETTQSGTYARTSYFTDSFCGIDTLVAGIDTVDVTGIDTTGWVITVSSRDTAMFVVATPIKDRIAFSGTSSPNALRYDWRASKTGR